MKHEYETNWLPASPVRRSRRTTAAKHGTVSVGLIAKIFLVGVIAGYLLGLVQQAAQKSNRRKFETGYVAER